MGDVCVMSEDPRLAQAAPRGARASDTEKRLKDQAEGTVDEDAAFTKTEAERFEKNSMDVNAAASRLPPAGVTETHKDAKKKNAKPAVSSPDDDAWSKDDY